MTATRFESIAPIFAVRDLSRAIRFYQDALGFDLAWSWGEPAHIAAVCRDAVEITLTEKPDAQAVGPGRIYLRVSGIDALYTTLWQAGAQVLVTIGDRAYGMRDFRVADPSGNEIDIGQIIPGKTDT